MEEQKQRIKAAVTLVLDLAKAFERVSLPVTHFGFPRKILRVLCGYFEHQMRGAVRRMCGRAARDHFGYFARVQVELLACTHCFCGMR